MDTFQIIALGLMGVIAISVIVVVVHMRRPLAPIIDLSSFDSSIERLSRAASHHVEVNAVLALTSTFANNPDLPHNLAGYSRQVVDAALTHRVNCLGNDLRVVDLKLSDARKSLAANPNPNQYQIDYRPNVTALEKLQANLQSQLDEVSALIRDRAALA